MVPLKLKSKREDIRDQLWPDASEVIFGTTKGFSRMPRITPIALAVLGTKSISGNENPASVYIELIARDMGDGIVEIRNERDHAFWSGYVNERGLRSWRERVAILEKHGFIRTKKSAATTYVLLINPVVALTKLRAQKLVEDEHWNALTTRLVEIKSDVPVDPLVPTAPATIPPAKKRKEK